MEFSVICLEFLVFLTFDFRFRYWKWKRLKTFRKKFKSFVLEWRTIVDKAVLAAFQNLTQLCLSVISRKPDKNGVKSDTLIRGFLKNIKLWLTGNFSGTLGMFLPSRILMEPSNRINFLQNTICISFIHAQSHLKNLFLENSLQIMKA